MIIERIKFYADFEQEKNKYFCFRIANAFALKGAIFRFFDKGYIMKALYYEKLDTETGEIIENTKLDYKKLQDEFIYTKVYKDIPK